jgi:hypothetical protein
MSTAIIPLPAFELAKIQSSDFKEELAKAEVARLIKAAAAVTAIFTQTDLNNASMVLQDIGKAKKAFESHRVQMKEPFLAHGKQIDLYFKQMGAELEAHDDRLLKAVKAFNQREKEIAQAKADEQRKKMEDLLKKENEERAAKGEAPSDAIIPEVVTHVEKLSDRNIGGLQETRYKRWEVEDISKVPVEYLAINEVKLNAKRKEYDFDAVSPISGIKFTVETSIKR